jgi:hypothetical protein
MRTYLQSAWEYVARLNGSLNSLKANVLYHLLKADLNTGQPNLERFKAYLELPRPLGHVHHDIVRSQIGLRYPCNLSEDYTNVVGLPPVFEEMALVRSYLHHFLRDSETPELFVQYFEDEFLKKEFARIKIVNGMGDWERWSKVLNPAEYKELVERVEIEFAETNPTLFGAEEQVGLDIDIKNANELIIKVFEINVDNYLRQMGRMVDTNINLDGLIPNWQRTQKLDQAPAIRKRHRFEFAELKKPGVYIIDFTGNGRSCRALVQKGRLAVTQRVTGVGHVFCVFDELGNLVKGANASLGNRRFEADEDGFIVVPFTTKSVEAKLIINHGSLATLTPFQHLEEKYELRAGFYVDREQLLKHRQAELVIRPSLLVAGEQIKMRDRLNEVSVTITTTNHEGHESQRTYSDIRLNDEGETTLAFQVPPRVGNVSFTLSASIRNTSLDRDDSLKAVHEYTINQIDQSDEIVDFHLLRNADQFVFEILGLTGEVRERQVVQVELKHQAFQRPITETLQSDESGRVYLGSLTEIEQVTASVGGGSQRTWSLSSLDQNMYFQTVTAIEGKPVLCAFPDSLTEAQRSEVCLFELRDSLIARNLTDQVKRNENLVLLTDLTAGDYLLQFGNSNQAIQISVTNGQQVGGYFVGRHRILEVAKAIPLSIGDPEIAGDDKLQLKLFGANDRTRVHIMATRYVPRFSAFEQLNRGGNLEPIFYRRGVNFNAYVSGRRIGDEYRYVIDRQSTPKFPGNMLDRPSLLLAPWSLGPTDNLEQQIQSGDFFQEAAKQELDSLARREQAAKVVSPDADFANLDFLFDESILLPNLRADQDGLVQIELAKLNDKTHLTILVVDDGNMVQRAMSFPAKQLKARNLRLLESYDATQSVAQRKSLEIIPANQAFEVNNVLTGRFRGYSDLKSVFRLFQGLPRGSNLSEWRFLLEWPKLTEEERLEKYGKFACHELNFYLWKKDRPFFDKHVKPFLANKFQKTFLDRWLLEEDLSQYLEPQQFAKLNPFEKILLADRMEDRQADILKQLSDQLEFRPLDQNWLDGLFDAAIANSPLDQMDATRKLSEKLIAEDPAIRVESKDLGRERNNESPAFAPVPMAAGKGGGGMGGERARSRPSDDKQQSGISIARMGGEIGRRELASDQLKKAAEDEFETVSESLRFDQKLEALNGKPGRRFYRQVAPTEEWVENNYYRLRPQSSSAELVSINQFRLDWARHEKQAPFLSTHFVQATSNFREMLLALAVLDLPAESEEPALEFKENSLVWTAPTAAIMFHQQIKPTPKAEGTTTILVSENFFQKDDRSRTENGLTFDKFLAGPFATCTLYGGQVVITNPTSTPRVIEMLMQVPAGAIATSQSQQTRTIKLVLPAFNSTKFEYHFYFPAAGTFKHFPAHVADQEHVVAVAQQRQFEVRDDLSTTDKSTWAFVSQSASNEEVLTFLREKNLLNIQLDRIAFRMKDKAFYEQTISMLKKRCVYNHLLWSYSLLHHDLTGIAEYLVQEPQVRSRVGQFIDSPILQVDDFVDLDYDHREFWPLINIRTHQVRKDREILNQRIHHQYHRLLNYLARKPRLSMADQLSITYYLLLQDRVAESLDRFAKLNRDQTNGAMQYDYLDAYLKFYQADVDGAEQIANRYTAYPMPHWRNRFAAIGQQIAEIRGNESAVVDQDHAAQVQNQLAASAARFEFEVVEDQVRVEHQNLGQLVVNYYLMDAELLFSNNLFNSLNVSSFSMIRPNHSHRVELAEGATQSSCQIPTAFQNRNLLLEIRAGDQVNSKAVNSNALKVQMIESYGQLRVTSAKDGQALPKTYVKVLLNWRMVS